MDKQSPHLPVLYQEILTALQPYSPGRYVDCTVGAGGHARGILEQSAPKGKLLGMDLDPDAIALARDNLKAFGGRAIIVQTSYVFLQRKLAEMRWRQVHGILLDLGVSSMQFDRAEKGFSFREEAPLDMRFDPGSGESAADLLNHIRENELAELLWKFGEERLSRRIARAIIAHRPVTTTLQLAELVKQEYGKNASRIHPATRTFQALRIAVNHELDNLEIVLPQAIASLAPRGRLAVISFHSLEDRIVKHLFQRESQDCLCPPEHLLCTCNHRASLKLVTRHPITASGTELETNERARSAKLRVAEKL